MVYLMANLAAAVGVVGSDTEIGQLAGDASCYVNMTQDQLEAGIVGILNGGLPQDYGWYTTSAVETLTQAQIVEGIKCYTNYSDEMLDLMLIRIICLFWGAQQSLA